MVLFIPKACAKCGNILVKNTEKVVIYISLHSFKRERKECAMTIPHSWIGMEWNGSTSNNFNLLSRQRQLDKKKKITKH